MKYGAIFRKIIQFPSNGKWFVYALSELILWQQIKVYTPLNKKSEEPHIWKSYYSQLNYSTIEIHHEVAVFLIFHLGGMNLICPYSINTDGI